MRHPRRATESSHLTSPQPARRQGGDPLVTSAFRDLLSSFTPILLRLYLHFHASPLPPFSFLLFSSFFSHPVTMGDAVMDRVSLWVLSLVSRVQQVHITQLGISVQGTTSHSSLSSYCITALSFL